MVTRRQRKVAELLHEEISQLIRFDSQDPRLDSVTVTGVDISRDLRQAKVYVTVLGDETEKKDAMIALQGATGFVRRELAQSLSLRHTPNLTFKFDLSLEHGMKVEKILNRLAEEQEDNELPEPE